MAKGFASAASAAAVLAVLAVPTGSALAKGGEVGGSGSMYFLNDSFTGTANIEFTYGADSDKVYFGDWNGDGVDTPMVRRGNLFYLRNSNAGGTPDVVLGYGKPSDIVLTGDWDGNGTDTLAVRRGATYYVKNSISGGDADTVLTYGRANDAVLVGDWDGNGTDTFAVRRGSIYYVKNTISTGVADYEFGYGRPTDSVLVGDWNGSGADTLGVRRGNTYYLKNTTTAGDADIVLAYGRATDTAFAGDWNGDRRDTLGVRRVPPPPAQFSEGVKVVNRDIRPGTYRATGTGSSCYWERLSGFSDTLDDVITNGFGDPFPIVTIDASDAGFTSSRCGNWIDVRASFPLVPATSFGPGTWVVGRHIEPGTYQASGTGSTYWERLSGFSGSAGDVIANDFGTPRPIVTIRPSDAGFLADRDAGTWTKIG